MEKRFASKKGIPCFSSNIKRAQTKGLAWCQYDSVRGITPLRNKRPATHCLFKPDANSRFFSTLPFLLYNGNNYAPLKGPPFATIPTTTSFPSNLNFRLDLPDTSIANFDRIYIPFNRIRNSKFRNNFLSILKMETCLNKKYIYMSSQPSKNRGNYAIEVA